MKYPYTGLYYFCKQLGHALLRQKPENANEIAFYVPQKEKNVFGAQENYIIQNHLHKFFPKNLNDYAVWHCTYQGSNYLPPKSATLKIISTIHDLNFLHQKKSASKQTKYLQKLQQLIDRSEIIVPISHFVKDQIMEHLDVTNKKVDVVYNGTNLPPEDLLFEKPPTIGNNPFFFTIGTITNKKNFHVLPAMLVGNNFELVIAGITQSKLYLNRIIEEAQRLGVEQRLKIIGPVSEAEKFWLLKNCLAFCFPSLAEGFGLPVVEAMQFGTPVILSKETSLPEIGGPHAFYFDSLRGEDITKAAIKIMNSKISEEQRNQLKQWALRFSWDIAARKYWALYASR